MSKLIENLNLKSLKASSKTQVRLELNPEALEAYTDHAKECKEKGADCDFPPLVVFRDDKGDHLGDGFTRRAALLAAGIETYPCEVKTGDARDAFLFGCVVNQQHGARLTNKDKKHILATALEDKANVELSDNGLATLLGLTQNYVRRNRPASKKPGVVTAVRKSGKKSKVKTGNIGKKGGKSKATKEKPVSEAKQKRAEENLNIDINKIVDAVGGSKDKLRAGLKTGTLGLDAKAISKLAEQGPDDISKLMPLITDLKKSVPEAMKIMKSKIGEKSRIEDAVLLAIAGGGFVKDKLEGSDWSFVIFDSKKILVEVSEK